MRILLCFFIMIFFGMIGYRFKLKQRREIEFYNYLNEFTMFCKSNISLFKNNMVNIIDSYIITQENKNANYNKLFVKNGSIYQISRNIIDKYIANEKDAEIVFSFLNGLGGNDYEFEQKRIDDFRNCVLIKKEKEFDNLLKNADLKFKVVLAIGAVVCIVIW